MSSPTEAAGATGGVLFHDSWGGEPPQDWHRSEHSPASPARVDDFAGRFDRGFGIFHSKDEPADPELSAADCEMIREFRRFRMAMWKSADNHKGLRVVELQYDHDEPPRDPGAPPLPHETLFLGWEAPALKELREANDRRWKSLADRCKKRLEAL